MSEFDEDVRLEAKRYSEVLNSVIGFFMFTTATVCLSFKHPQTIALLFLTMVMPVYVLVVNNFFPPTIDTLRKLLKEEPENEWAKSELDFLTNKYLGVRKIFTANPVFWSGNFWYILILCCPEFSSWIKCIKLL
ncbi:hypothetical protein FE236_02440 [Mariprofundus erugo]|uniref:hypothetical protein n=1 Tax=Mariprofundus erugo TaxID=2528639 RepID=UPI0010FF2807|nr:hypothetical protein [Mariprofundus erugo]TLS77968.1 hypothetical protein FE236_02440 [Mariprofundus erugo]